MSSTGIPARIFPPSPLWIGIAVFVLTVAMGLVGYADGRAHAQKRRIHQIGCCISDEWGVVCAPVSEEGTK